MQYLQEALEIKTQIAKFALFKTLCLDTEIADWSASHRRLSLIQVLAEPTDSTGEAAYILDVLNQPNLATLLFQMVQSNK
jgi:S-DNA-T family DNA segregation ATPase FtsK/SpoIIIE